MSYDVINMLCLISCVSLVLFVLAVLASSSVLVERIPCLCSIMCPFCVSSDSRNNLVTFLMLMSGQVRYFPLWVALSYVAFFGKSAAG